MDYRYTNRKKHTDDVKTKAEQKKINADKDKTIAALQAQIKELQEQDQNKTE